MANRVNVNITARDLTRGDLGRIRRNFNALGQDVNRAVGARTRQNFSRLSQSVNQSRRDLMAMRGSIPDDEFFRLDEALRRSQRRLQRGFGNVGNRAFARIVADLQQVNDGFRDLDDNAQIRVRVDNSALRRADAQLATWRRQQDARIRAGQNAILRADRRLAAGLRSRDGDSTRVRVRVDPDTRGFGPRLRRSLLRWTGLRQAGAVIGGTLSDGIGQGIIGGFRSAGPIGIAVFAAIIAGSLAIIGAALAGLLVFAIGGAFVGLGAFLASKSDEVQRNWKSAAENIKKSFEGTADALVKPMHRAIHVLEDMAADFAPHFERAMTQAAPALDKFVDSLDAGFREFGSRAFKPLMEGFNAFILAFGPEFESFMRGFGDAMGALGRTVRDHSTEIAMAFGMVLGLITTVIDIVNFLANAWVMALQLMVESVGFLSTGLGFMLDTFYVVVDGMLAGLETVGGLIGLEGPIKTARENLAEWRENTKADLTAASTAASNWGASMDAANKKRKLEIDIAGYKADLQTAREKLKQTTNQKARAKLAVEIAQALRNIATARARLDALNGKTVYTYISTSQGGHPTQRKATGGNIGSAATGGARSNLTLVGEHGAELVDLAPGSRVRSNPDTRRLMGGQESGGNGTFVFKSSGRRVDDLLLEILREAIHQRGGDPITVLGG